MLFQYFIELAHDGYDLEEAIPRAQIDGVIKKMGNFVEGLRNAPFLQIEAKLLLQPEILLVKSEFNYLPVQRSTGVLGGRVRKFLEVVAHVLVNTVASIFIGFAKTVGSSLLNNPLLVERVYAHLLL